LPERRDAGTDLKQQTVLFRTSSHSGPTQTELTSQPAAERSLAVLPPTDG